VGAIEIGDIAWYRNLHREEDFILTAQKRPGPVILCPVWRLPPPGAGRTRDFA
jgi:hypothetical protein